MAEKSSKIVSRRRKKRLFIGMITLSLAVLAACLGLLWYLALPRLIMLWEPLPFVVGGLFLALIALGGWGVLSIVLALKGAQVPILFKKQTYAFINMLFPMAVSIAKVFGIGRRELEGSFIAVSNLLFSRMGVRVPAERLLVVTPHCLQLASCPHKITRDPHNCKRCGGCDIGALVTLSEELGFHFFVATGGTLARQIVKNARPKAVLAIACERDLMSGIQDVYPLPAVGVLNIRPNGPCYNTHVDMDEVRAELKKIIIPKEEG